MLDRGLFHPLKLAALIALLGLVGLAAVLERSLRHGQRAMQELSGRESRVPNYRHIWFAHDPAFVRGGQMGDRFSQLGMLLKNLSINWQEACWGDLDYDGLTNGEELGDPCCLWVPQAVEEPFSLGSQHEYRRWDISHPSSPASPSPDKRESIAARAPLNCSDYDAGLYAKQFRAFYFQGAHGPLESTKLVPAKVVSLVVLVLMLAHWFRNKGLAADAWPWLFYSRAQLPPRVSLAVCAASFVYMDLTSGIVHITLDYAPNWLPGLGPLAKGFQYHHYDPTAIIRISWYAYVSHVHLLCPLIAALLLFSNASRVSRLFWFWGAVFVHAFQTTHRWAHFEPDQLPSMVRLVQSSGLFLTHARHMMHHEDLERQFAILSGVTDGILDAATRLVPPWRYDLWIVLGTLWFLLPVCLDLRFHGYFEALGGKTLKIDIEKV